MGGAIPVRCDVTDAQQVTAAVDAAMSAFGRIGVLINNAGQGLQAPIEEIEPADAGHAPTMTLDTYAHLFDERDGDQTASAEDLIRAARAQIMSPEVSVLCPSQADPATIDLQIPANQ